MPWGPHREQIPNVTGGAWRPRDTVISPPDTTPGWWVRTPVEASFSGNGVLAAQIKQISPRDILLNGEGNLVTPIYQKYLIPPQFNSEGTFAPQVMQREFRQANFNGMGYTVFDCVSIILDDKDGLTATAYERYPQIANFSGAGNLAVAVRGYATMIANLSGNGQLSMEITKQLYAMTVAFSGNGAFTPGAFKGLNATANFLGSGQLSATVFEKYLRALPASGAGALTAMLAQKFDSGGAGEGTMAATIMQKYFIALGFGDDFNRADSTTDPGNGWKTRNGVMGINGNQLYPAVSGAWCLATAPVVSNSDDMEVTITLGNWSGGGGDYTAILLGFNDTGEGAFVFFNGGAGVTIYTQSDWSPALSSVATAPIPVQSPGDRFRIKRVGNVYTVLRNQNLILTWPDSGNIVPRDINHRQCGAACYNDGSGYRGIDFFDLIEAGSLNGDGVLSASVFKKELRNAALSGGGLLTATTRFPTVAETTTTYTAAGAYTFPIPYWCRYIDVILLGGGGGGRGGQSFGTSVMNGGGPGVWDYTTWERGVHIPWSTSQVLGVVGAGGSAGAVSAGAGGVGNPSNTQAVPGGSGARSATGGPGGGTGGDAGQKNGAGAATQTFNGKSYPGSSASGGIGIAPGGGGAGGSSNLFGGGGAAFVGATGQVWFRCYQ